MSLEKPARTWHEIAIELLASEDPQTIVQLAADMVAAFERDEANRKRPAGSESARGTHDREGRVDRLKAVRLAGHADKDASTTGS
jgi:hypothetical protein